VWDALNNPTIEMTTMLRNSSCRFKKNWLLQVCLLLVLTANADGQDEPCQICPKATDFLESPNAIIPDGTISGIPSITSNFTCGELATTLFRPLVCSYIKKQVETICTCVKPLSAKVDVIMSTIESKMSADVITEFESSMTSFLQSSITETQVIATVCDQKLGEVAVVATNTTRSRLVRQRSLQENATTSALTVCVEVQGVATNLSDWTTDVVNAVSDNPEDIISALKFQDPAFFGDLNTLSVEPTPEPIVEPEEASADSGLGTGAIVGIVLGVVAVMGVAIVCGAMNDSRRKVRDEEIRNASAATATPKPKPAPANVTPEPFITKVIVAPAGKLGIVIDSTPQGPVIHKVKEGSPLEGKLSVGDIIVDIDSIDTRSMTASSITSLMVDSIENERRITVLTRGLPTPIPISIPAGMVEKVIMAPPGKLGIVVDSTPQGPIIHTIREGSPLLGKTAAGDIIIEVNGISCRTMKASAVTKLMVDTAEQERKIVVYTKPSSSVSTAPDGYEMKFITAPAGRLGIVVDTTQQGAVVTTVRDDSPLLGNITVGDIMVQVNGTDCRTMKASAVTKLMIDSAESERKIVVFTRKTPVPGLPEGYVEKNINAPAGKLGIVVDSTQQGPVVTTVRDDSPLRGSVSVGDIIKSVNGTDCRTMKASAVTKIMIDSAESERKIVVLTKTATATPIIIKAISVPKPVSVLPEGYVEKVITAPAGKLGIVVDTKQEGPVIATVRDDSPLLGNINVGDIIVAVNGTECRKMKSSEVTKLMVDAADRERKISVLTKMPISDFDSTEKLITAPAGKLGIVIDSTPQGPVVHTVRDDSPLLGSITVGDIIIEVNGIKCRTMTSSEVTKLMVSSSEQERRLLVLTKTPVLQKDLVEKVVTAPAGKLGIVIDSTQQGPVVHTVRDDSPLLGEISVGDIVIQVNGTDCRMLKSSAVTKLMVDSADKERIIVVLTKQPIAAPSAISVPKPVLPDGYVEKTIMAPAGKLGIVIEKRTEGAIIESIRGFSPLLGKIMVGDILIEVNGTDCRNVTASAVTKLMTESANQERKLVFLSKQSTTSTGASPVIASSTDGLVKKEVVAPPGKLGIVIERRVEGPTVQKIRDESPLLSQLVVGDIIIAVNGVSCRAMAASEVTKLMVESAEQQRTLVVLTKPETVGITETGVRKAVPTDGMVEKVIMAPPGRLGIVIDSREAGPVVLKIRSDSPLLGQIQVGDVVIEVNGTDCRTLTAAAVTKVMVDSALEERKIVVFTKDESIRTTNLASIAAPSAAAAATAVGTTYMIESEEEQAARSLSAVDEGEEPTSEPPTIGTTDASATIASESEPEISIAASDPSPEIPPTASVPEPVPTSSETQTAADATKAAPTSATADTSTLKNEVIVAPPGKLLIVIDNSVAGPVVTKIKEGSPLEGKLRVGDIIIDVDGTDTRSLSAAIVTTLMVKSSSKERQLTVQTKA
jgi:C-terminal processing protease CtpA/Prc